MTATHRLALAGLLALGLLVTGSAVRAADEEGVPSFRKGKDKDSKEFVAKVFESIVKAARLKTKNHKVEKFVTPEEFKSYETVAYTKGFLMVSSSPLTRSSHHAGDDFARLRAAREKKLQAAE